MLLLAYPQLHRAAGRDGHRAGHPARRRRDLGHLFFGDVQVGLAVALLAGALPGGLAQCRRLVGRLGRLIKPVVTAVLLRLGAGVAGRQPGRRADPGPRSPSSSPSRCCFRAGGSPRRPPSRTADSTRSAERAPPSRPSAEARAPPSRPSFRAGSPSEPQLERHLATARDRSNDAAPRDPADRHPAPRAYRRATQHPARPAERASAGTARSPAITRR
ncbi:hypothetical protein HBB16_19930 [Pseudonocardia sp. MCCB 268]|nr:hypothetical protein [Pseudonocardia cytotoxica]